MAAEISEQPEVWHRLLTAGADAIAHAAVEITTYTPRFVMLAGRGTSNNAALYAKYLIEVGHGIPAGLVSPSTVTVYDARPAMRDVLYIAVSQSGGSPDLVQSLQAAREQGALTVAVTNNVDSDLANAAQLVIDIMAGPERAVAATKSYTASLLALHLLLERIRGDGLDVHKLPELASHIIESAEAVHTVAERYRFAQRLIVTGRGYSYATAREAALKLMETCYLSAQAFSGADLLHGPLASVDPLVPVLAVVPAGAGGRAMLPALDRLAERNADVFGIGDPDLLTHLTGGIPLPADVPEELSPLLEILPLQQLALHLAIARGEDPDQPRGLQKVTETL